MAGEDVLGGLLARTAAGDQAAFRALYERSAGRLFAVALRIVPDRAAAETVLQESYARIFARAREFDPAHDALAWMIAITRHGAIDAARSRPRDPANCADALDLGPIELAPVGRRLGELDEPVRRAVLLAYRGGLSYDELGAVLGVSSETAKTYVSRALMSIRQSMDDA